MKLFKQLLVAPAALGLLAPMAAGATEVNVAGVSDYASVSHGTAAVDQVTSITQFSDVYPTDWAYQALSNLIERYGCVAGYPNGTYRGNRAMTRFEAAALLNACLDRVTEVTDELKRLMKEFEKELAIVKGRVDGLEARVGELEATQFSTTTKLDGQTSFVFGANAFGGDLFYSNANLNSINSVFPSDGEGDGGVAIVVGSDDLDVDFPKGTSYQDYAATQYGATTFNYDIQLNFNTSFTGKDLLTTTLRAGNFGNSSFGGGPTTLSTLEVASDSLDGGGAGDAIYIDKIFYSAPLGSDFTFIVGANVGQDDMMPMWPSIYPSGDGNTVLDVLTLNGAPGAYNKTQGPGAALNYENNGWVAGVQYVCDIGTCTGGNPQTGGIAADDSNGVGTVQVGYQGDQWGIAAVYSWLQNPALLPYSTAYTQLSYLQDSVEMSLNAFALSAYWQPEDTGWIPAISAGWGLNSTNFNDSDDVPDGYVSTSQSWQVALHWDDAFIQGNTAGMAVGQATFATDLVGGDTPSDANYVWEWFYGFQVTDNVTLTPALFYLSRPLGQLSFDGDEGKDGSFNQFGGIVRTTFTF